MKKRRLLLKYSLIVLIVFMLISVAYCFIPSSESYAEYGKKYYACPGQSFSVTIPHYPDDTGHFTYKFSGCNCMNVTGTLFNYSFTINDEGTYDIVGDSGLSYPGDYYFTAYIGHEYDDEYTIDKPATCTENGSKSYHCKHCKATTGEVVIPAGHSWEETPTVDIEPTCTTDGSQSIHCQNCDERKDIEVLDKLGHDLVHHDAKEATYSECGWNEYDTCTRCDYSTYKEIPELPKTIIRELSFSTYEPTAGYNMAYYAVFEGEGCSIYDVFWSDETNIYSVDDEDQTNAVFDKDKKYTVNIVVKVDEGYCMSNVRGKYALMYFNSVKINGNNPTHFACIDEDKQLFGFSYDFDHTHIYKEVVTKQPSCTKDGELETICEVCNKTFYKDTVEKKGHSWGTTYKVDKAATCTEEGSESIHCSRCDVIKEGSSRRISKKAHSYGAWNTTKAATELAAGQKVHNCSRCGYKQAASIAQLKPSLPAITIISPKATKRSATLKWKKVSKANQKKIASIQIQYSLDKNFKKGVKTTTAKKTATSKKISKLASKKTYYVRVRSYKKDKKGVHISKWSAVKAVKVK